uniref:Putative udp-glucuronosyltransferase n=1 Tax=Corethrella appendiculata TaxID=1370023 RepID=U5EN10_9DIPT
MKIVKMDIKFCAILIIVNFTVIQIVHGSKILAVFPIPFREHQYIYRPLIETLAQNGHEILLLTTDPINFDHKDGTISGNNSLRYQIEQIDLSFVYSLPALDRLHDNHLAGPEMLKNVFDVLREISEAELQYEPVRKLIQNNFNRQFDVVLVEWSGMTLMNVFAEKFNCPLIGITNAGAFINSHEALGNPNHPICYPSIFMPFTDNLTLLQRISSVFFSIWYRYYYFTEEIPQQNAIVKKYFDIDLPDLWEIENSADLLLINSYIALGNVRPIVPTTIYLGGIHSKFNFVNRQQQQETLPYDLKLFIEQTVADTDKPLVYVNLNNDYRSSRLQKLINALEMLNYNVIWNWNNGNAINTTLRIYQSTNLPQEDILANKHVKLFITDGGQRNIEDAIHYKVPVFGISYPRSLEHYFQQIEKHEAGVISFIDFESELKFTDKLDVVLHSDSYQINMNKLHRHVLDEPMTSLERAVWWINYVLRNNGTKHLHTTKLSWFQYFLLDVVLTLFILTSIVVCVFAYLLNKAIKYSKSLPFEMVTKGSRKCKVL